MWEQWKKGWGSFCQKKRVVVHVPSLSFQPYQRKNIHNFPIHQNSQITRLVDLADPNVDVLYISPFEVNQDIVQYYTKLLEVGGIPNCSSRFKFLVPDYHSRLPEHFSLSKVALYSPKLLHKIKSLIRGRPAYLVPGEVGPEDLQLAVELGLPLLSPEPEKASHFGSKSGNKRIFALAEVGVPPGVHDIFEQDDLYAFFSKLLVNHLDCPMWVFKIDNESGGRGVAYLDATTLKDLAALRKEKSSHPVRWKLPETLTNAHQRLEAVLRDNLAKKLVLATPAIYDDSITTFLLLFCRMGGVIEAGPTNLLSSPSANLLVEPDGTVTVLSSHEQIFQSPFVYSGASFPAQLRADVLHPAAIAIGRACFREGLIGYIGVDFVYHNDHDKGNEPILWAVDLNLRMTSTQASFNLFHFLMQGRYHKLGSEENPNVRYTMRLRDDKKKAFTKSDGLSARPASQRDYEKERFYSVVNYVYQPNLATIQFGSFFNLCRMKGISFDLGSKTGTVFIMLDSLASGTIGIMSIADTHHSGLRTLNMGLSFLQEQAGNLRLSDHVYAGESNLVNVTNAVRAKIRVLDQHAPIPLPPVAVPQTAPTYR